MSGECVKVVVRIRPLSSTEVSDGRRETVKANSARAEVAVESADAASKEAAKTFTFDATFGSDSTQVQLYDSAAYPIVESVLKGFNGTILAVRGARWRARGLPAARPCPNRLSLPPAPLTPSHKNTPPPPPPRAVRPNRRGQVAHHGGQDLPARAARHHPQDL